jgi:hypothetical protein
MPKKYLVEIEEECPVCNGKRYYHHPVWDRYWEETDGQGLATDIEKEVWFLALGYTPVPREQVPCDFCDYSGQTRRRVDLAQALADLGLLPEAQPAP